MLEKKAQLAQEEIGCALELFRRFAAKDAAAVQKPAVDDPATKLAALGAVARLAEGSEGRSGRELEDVCGVAERLWASELIAAGAAEISAPPIACYEAAFRVKFRTGAIGQVEGDRKR